MFKFSYTGRFNFCILDQEGNKIPVSEWEAIQSQYLSQLSILKEFTDNGVGELQDDDCQVAANAVLQLSELDKQILFLPDPYPYEIYIQSDGQLNQSTFRFSYGFYDFTPNGNRLHINRNGPLINIEDRMYMLSVNQFMVCEAMEQFNSLPEQDRTYKNNLKIFADIKSFSSEAATYLDSYLESQSYYHPDKIKIEVEFSGGCMEIIPTIDIDNSVAFTNSFDQFPNIREVYPVRDGKGGTVRVVIDDDKKIELQKFKQYRKVKDPELIQQIVEHPERFFNDESSDFSIFYSERVKDIGIYKPKFYPFVSPYKSEWIPGIVIKDKILGEKKILFKTSDELHKFIEAKQSAKSDGKSSVEWKGSEIPIIDAEKFIEIADRQFQNPKEPVEKKIKQSSDEVLIIKENADFTEYVQYIEENPSITHNFSRIDNLSHGIHLKDHQMEGISWLQSLHKEKFCGCLLADDMGLGKTLQLLYFIEWHAQSHHDYKPYLIVAPVTLLENWENEYEKFFSPKTLSLTKLYGNISLTKDFNSAVNKADAADLQRRHIILTNYETLKIYQSTICLINFAVVALDEAQKIKTPGTLVTNCSKALKADFKIAMTGTPVENTLLDLWCIMDFSVPGLLSNAKDFSKEFQNPLKDVETNVPELTEKLRQKIGVFIKRRLKKDVAKDLPRKFDNENSRIKCAMPDVQLERYKIAIEQARSTNISDSDRRNRVLKALWAIRDISDHPYLADNQISKFSSEELINSSAKLSTVIGLLTNIKLHSDKVIVFADRKETQKMLQKVIYDSFGIFPSIVNGDTPTTKKDEGKVKLSRQQTIDRFQSVEGFNVIVMSPLAAGIGLNVTEANHVIHYSRHWNPAKEEQATDRAYRIGQIKDVHVYYPMAVFPEEMENEDGSKLKSFDEILDLMLDKKKFLASSTLFPTEQAEVKPDEIFDNIFGFTTDSKSIPYTIQQADKLNPHLFEALICALYCKMGYDATLTPYSNDKGVDVVALSNNKNILFQVKQTKSQVGIDAVQEISAAKKYYEGIYNENFELMIITNSNLSPAASTLAFSNKIESIRRSELEKMILKYEITIADVNRHDAQRMSRI